MPGGCYALWKPWWTGETFALLVYRIYSPEGDSTPSSPHQPHTEDIVTGLVWSLCSGHSLCRLFPRLSISLLWEALKGPDKAGRPSTQEMVCEQLVEHWESLHWTQGSSLCYGLLHRAGPVFLPVVLQICLSWDDLSSADVSGVLGNGLIHFLPQHQALRLLTMLDGDAQRRWFLPALGL